MPTTSQKPYRVYRQPRRVRGDGAIAWGDVEPGRDPGKRGKGLPRRGLRLVRRVIFVALAAGIIWATIAFLSFRSAVEERNDALPKDVRAALAPADGPALVDDHVTLLVGADTSAFRRRGTGEKEGRADSLILMRVDVPSRTVSMLSIPRDLEVEIPGVQGKQKINAAYPIGGLPLSIRTVRSLTGIDVNHVAQIDFDGFRDVVEAIGGIEIDNPTYLASGEDFDGRHWVFRKGKIGLDGRGALAYSRMRKLSESVIAANPNETTDLARAQRQQRVIDAIVKKVVSTDSLLHPREVPKAVVKPLLTDISAGQMLTFGFGKWWSKPENSLRCRLGGDVGYNDEGQEVLIPSADNKAVVRMWLGKQAPIKPRDSLSAGCVRQGAKG